MGQWGVVTKLHLAKGHHVEKRFFSGGMRDISAWLKHADPFVTSEKQNENNDPFFILTHSFLSYRVYD
jgi:hypothetical protein